MPNLLSQPPTANVWSMLRGQDWLSRDFTREKAYICAIFAELAYWHIPNFELAESDRIKVVPSSAYQQLALYGRADEEWERLRQRLDMPTTIITRRYAVVLIARTPQVIFVAIRGTAAAYDWTINTDLRKTPYEWATASHGRFHGGFYAAVRECFDAILGELSNHDPDVPVYVVGHSLGGAMAAILHSVYGACKDCGSSAHGYRTYSAFTYGMPRYANSDIVGSRPCPHHILKSDDIVPRVPPRWLGYANSQFEYSIDGSRLNRADLFETIPSARWAYRLATGRAVTQHFMEGYRASLVP